MPRLWNETIETHRQAVQEAILNSTWELATERGLAALTMSEIAERAGVGRATLYKYFPDVESIFAAGHQRHITHHIERLLEVRREHDDPAERLRGVLHAYASIIRRHDSHAAELHSLLHRREEVKIAYQRLLGVIGDVLADASKAGVIRDDIVSGELARYCIHALSAAADAKSGAAIERLVDLVMQALHQPAAPSVGS